MDCSCLKSNDANDRGLLRCFQVCCLRSLSGKDGVNEGTRKKALRVASDLGYLNQKKNKTNQIMLNNELLIDGKQIVLVLLQNIRSQTKESSYWGRIIKGVSKAIEKLGFGMVVVTEENLDNLTTVINLKGYVGIISIGVVTTNLLLEVDRMNIPIVMIDHEDYLISCDSVFNDNVDASEKVVNYLVGLGHERIQFIGDVSFLRSFYDRWVGFFRAIELTGKEIHVNSSLCGIPDREFKSEFSSWVNDALGKKESLTAFVCANDQTARKVITILEDKGLKIPRDVSVTGFDNNKEDSYQITPTLTTVNVAKEDLGKRGVEVLVRRLKEKDAPYEKVLLVGEIILRDSTRSI